MCSTDRAQAAEAGSRSGSRAGTLHGEVGQLILQLLICTTDVVVSNQPCDDVEISVAQLLQGVWDQLVFVENKSSIPPSIQDLVLVCPDGDEA